MTAMGTDTHARAIVLLGNFRAGRGGISEVIAQTVHALQGEGFRVSMVNTHGNMRARIMSIPEAVRHFRGARVIVVHASGLLGMWPAIVTRIADPCNHRDKVMFFHDGTLEHIYDRHPLVQRLLFQIAPKRVAVPSRSLQRSFEKLGYHATTLPLHFAFLEDEPPARAPLQPTFLWARHFEEIYDPATAIRAFHLLRRTRPEAALFMYGGGRLRRQCMENNKGENIYFPGWIPREELLRRFATMPLLINTSRYDSFGINILEAAWHGMGIATTRVGGIPEILSEKACFPFETGDPRSLAAAMQAMLDHPVETARRRRLAQQEVRQFTWPRQKDRWLAFLGLSAAGHIDPSRATTV